MNQIHPDQRVYPVNKLATVANLLREEGIALEQALKHISLSESDLGSPATRVSLNQFIQCCHNAIRLSADPQFAYHAGLRLHVPTFGMFGFAILSSTEYLKTVRFVSAYRQVVGITADLSFMEVDNLGIWKIIPISLPIVDAVMYRFLTELEFGTLTTLHRDILGRLFAPRTLRVTYAPPDAATPLAEIAGCQVAFGQTENMFMFDSKWLHTPLELGDEVTFSMLVGVCDRLLAELQLNIGLPGKVRALLLPNLAQRLSFDAVAAQLNMTTRTLRRKLGEQSTSFRALQDELRMEVAIKYLRETNLTIDDIAYLVGFSEASNFRHAFRRWTNKVPDEFRGVGRPRPDC